MKRGITLEDIKNAVRMTKEAGIRAGGFWMMGFPPEKEEHIRATVNLIEELRGLDWNSELSVLVPYPGTDVYKEMKEEGLVLSENWEYYFKVLPNLVEPPIRTRYLTSKELLELKKKYDREIVKYTYRNILIKHLRQPHKVLASFVANPKDFFRCSYRLTHSYLEKTRKRFK